VDTGTCILDRHDIDGVQPLWSFNDVKRYGLAGLQGFITFHRNCRIVCKEITAAIVGQDETETLGVIEPLDLTGTHTSPPSVVLIEFPIFVVVLNVVQTEALLVVQLVVLPLLLSGFLQVAARIALKN